MPPSGAAEAPADRVRQRPAKCGREGRRQAARREAGRLCRAALRSRTAIATPAVQQASMGFRASISLRPPSSVRLTLIAIANCPNGLGLAPHRRPLKRQLCETLHWGDAAETGGGAHRRGRDAARGWLASASCGSCPTATAAPAGPRRVPGASSRHLAREDCEMLRCNYDKGQATFHIGLHRGAIIWPRPLQTKRLFVFFAAMRCSECLGRVSLGVSGVRGSASWPAGGRPQKMGSGGCPQGRGADAPS